MYRKTLFLCVALLPLASCNYISNLMSGPQGCLNPAGQTTAIGAITDAVETYISKSNDDAVDPVPLPKSKIRATLDQIQFVFEDVRTSKKDPNSTKNFCSSTLKATFPEDMLKDADKVASILSIDSLNDRLDKLDIKRDANSLRIDTDFNVQPTDDGEKVYAEVENADPTTHLIGDIIIAHLLRKRIEQANQDRLNKEASDRQQQEQAETEQKEATYDEAKATFDLSNQGIGATWNAISPDVRQRILPLQRAWIKRKDADCKIEAANASLDPTEREAARLQCEARANNQRASELGNLLNQNNDQSEETY